jgi:hypothetical protein
VRCRTFEIRRREATVILDRVVDEGLGEEDPGIVDQSVDRAEPRKRGFDDGLSRLRVGDVAIDADQAVECVDLRRLADPPRGCNDVVTPFEKAVSEAGADALRSASDDDRLVRHLISPWT